MTKKDFEMLARWAKANLSAEQTFDMAAILGITYPRFQRSKFLLEAGLTADQIEQQLRERAL